MNPSTVKYRYPETTTLVTPTLGTLINDQIGKKEN